MGGEGATPYEVLLHAAMVGESTRFTRQDGVEQTWRIMQPLLDAPPPVHRTRPARGAPRPPTSSSRATAAGAGRGSCHELGTRQPRRRGRRARPRPRRSPPIADYGVPLQLPYRGARGARRRHRLALRPALRLAERVRQPARPRAGTFRFAPFNINHPDRARVRAGDERPRRRRGRRRPGGSSFATALTMGPRDHEDEITPHTRPPADDDADHVLVRTVECLEGTVEVELVCEPVFDYGSEPADVDAGRREPPRRRRDRWPGRRSGSRRISRSGSRAAVSGHATCSGRATGRIARCPGPRGWRAPRTSTRPRHGWPRPSASGAPGWGERGYPTIAGATRSSVRHSRSRD